MLDRVLDIASWTGILAGSFFLAAGAVGVLRLRDFYMRQHAAGITDTLAAALILFGLMLQLPFGIVTIKLVLILLFLAFTSPTASHALAQAALASGLKPKAEELRKQS